MQYLPQIPKSLITNKTIMSNLVKDFRYVQKNTSYF